MQSYAFNGTMNDEPKLKQMNLRLPWETYEVITKVGGSLGINDGLMCRILLENAVRLIRDEEESPNMPPMLVAARACLKGTNQRIKS